MKDSLEQSGDLSPDNCADEEVKTFVTRGIIPGPLPVRRSEEETVKTTIVGGRPPTSGRPQGNIPRGIEVLIKKAAVDLAFRKVLLEKRAEASREIGLELSPAEVAAINAVTAAQLEQIIANTRVPDLQRRAFLGQVGAAMLAALTAGLAGCETQARTPYVVEKGVTRLVERGQVIEQPTPVERLGVTVYRGEAGSVIVSVSYDSAFTAGEVAIDFRQSPGVPGASITYQPAQPVAVSRGSGQVTFQASGSGGATNWLLVGLRDATAGCQNSPSLAPPAEYRPGQYIAGGCAVWKIVEYDKDWSSEE
jgi:hypothetical protein